MLSTVPLIATRLAAALGTGWDVTDGTAPQDRRTLPLADVRLTNAVFSSASGPNVTLRPHYTVTLVVDASNTAYELLETAVDQVIASVHHWRPTAKHQRLALQGLNALDFAEQTLLGFGLVFTLLTTRPGCNE
ncbi:MAG: hypothetical protein WA917_13620 [Comamonas sp.]